MLNPANRGLYAITDGPRDDLLARVEAALDAGAMLLQYRDKSNDGDRRRNEAEALQKLCVRYAVPLIINDDVALAAEVRAAGVHLGEDDIDIASARAQLGTNAIVGVSCYDSLQYARELAQRGASYLAFGSFFDSPTKPAARRATPELLIAAHEFGLPLVAIGGITAENGASLIQAGADYLAVISGIFGATDTAIAARKYVRLFASV
ncbi:thiamine phosphate synthase [Pseudolysobacter antarcticus]|uniref:thiamine phosphate synthase n=1 Tax=Pseudolysobacter antarcticus TaxID=2511995 RepID=UPI0026B250EB